MTKKERKLPGRDKREKTGKRSGRGEGGEGNGKD